MTQTNEIESVKLSLIVIDDEGGRIINSTGPRGKAMVQAALALAKLAVGLPALDRPGGKVEYGWDDPIPVFDNFGALNMEGLPKAGAEGEQAPDLVLDGVGDEEVDQRLREYLKRGPA